MTTVTTMLIAMIIDVAVGWPNTLYQRIRHPVVWIGALTSKLEGAFNKSNYSPLRLRLNGTLLTLLVIGACLACVFILAATPIIHSILILILSASLLAVRSLYEHVDAVLNALTADNTALGRMSVAKIVGRDVDEMTKADIASAAIESLAESHM